MLVALVQAIVSGLAVGGAYALIALGFSITFTTTKTLNFSHGDFVSVGAFIGVTILWLLLGKPINAPLTDADDCRLAAARRSAWHHHRDRASGCPPLCAWPCGHSPASRGCPGS